MMGRLQYTADKGGLFKGRNGGGLQGAYRVPGHGDLPCWILHAVLLARPAHAKAQAQAAQPHFIPHASTVLALWLQHDFDCLLSQRAIFFH